MPTITLITNEFPPIINGGVGNTARILANNLYKKENLMVNIITMKYGKFNYLPSIEKKENLTIYRIKIPEWMGKIYKPHLLFPFFSFLFSLRHKDIIRDSDILHSIHVRDIPFFLKQGKPVVLNISDFYPSVIPFNPFKYPFNERGKFLKYLNQMFFRFLDRLSIKKADAILCECNYALNIVELKRKYTKGKTYMIHKGIDLPRDTKGIKKEFEVIFIGSRFEIKGAKEVIFAINLLKKKYPNIRCLMLGRYSKYDYDYNKFIKENNLENNIIILGSTPHEDVINYLLKSKIYVIPTHLESLAQTAIEAMAAKLPIISSDVGGMPEAVTEDVGFIIKPTDYEKLAEYIDFLLSNPEIAEKMGEAGYKRVKNGWTEEMMIKRYIEVYNKFLNENQRISI